MAHQTLHLGPPLLPFKRKVSQYINQHKQAFLWGIKKLVAMPFATLVAVLIIGISLALPLAMGWLLSGLQSVTQQWYRQEAFFIYLHKNVAPSQVQSLLGQLRANQYVLNVQYVSPKKGLAEFKQHADVTRALEDLGRNPLPGMIVLQPYHHLSIKQLSELNERIAYLPSVEYVQFDRTWSQRLHAFISLAQKTLYSFLVLIGLGIILTVSNIVRLCLQGHQDEIAVLVFIGATPGYIRRPFLYTGFMIGFIGGVVAWLLTAFLLYQLSDAIEFFVRFYSTYFSFPTLTSYAVFLLLSSSSGLGLLGAGIGLLESHKSCQFRINGLADRL